MAQVVDAGDNAFAAMAYGRPSEKTFGFLDQSISHFTNSLADYAQNFYSTCRSVYNRIDNSEAMRFVKAAYGAIDTYAMHDVIQRLDHIPEGQQQNLQRGDALLAVDDLPGRDGVGTSSLGAADNYRAQEMLAQGAKFIGPANLLCVSLETSDGISSVNQVFP